MEGQSGEGAARKRRRSESKEEELEALAASARRREDNAGSLSSRNFSMADMLRASSQQPGGLTISALAAAGGLPPQNSNALGNISLSSSLLPQTGSLARNNQLMQNQLVSGSFAWPQSSFLRPLQLPAINQRNFHLGSQPTSMLGGLGGSRNALLQGRSLEQMPAGQMGFQNQLLDLMSAQNNAMLQNRPMDHPSAQNRLAYANVQRRMSQEALLLTSGRAGSLAIRPNETMASLLHQSDIASQFTAPATSSPSLEANFIVKMYIPCDDDSLTPYQCLARKQIELFAAGPKEVKEGTQGRNRSVTLGQVGIRCRHCKHLHLRDRARASTYYPSKLLGLYQAGQNMANSHLAQYCQQIPKEIRDEMERLGNKKSAAGGGKEYWANGAELLGVVEDDHGLRFKNSNPRQQPS